MLHCSSCVCLQGNLFLAVRFRALDKDALNSSHAVSTEVNTLEQVEEMFDSVTYEKVHFYICYISSYIDAVFINLISYPAVYQRDLTLRSNRSQCSALDLIIDALLPFSSRVRPFS